METEIVYLLLGFFVVFVSILLTVLTDKFFTIYPDDFPVLCYSIFLIVINITLIILFFLVEHIEKNYEWFSDSWLKNFIPQYKRDPVSRGIT